VAAVTSMEPIPETVEAFNELEPAYDEGDLLAYFTQLAGDAREIVPDLVGVSIAGFDHGLTFTLVATDEDVAVLDAVQYVGGGPCVEAAHTDQVMELQPDALDEERWRLFAEGTAARAVRSTLTLPVLSDGRVAGTVNLYAASRRAFVEHHEELAAIFGAWAAGDVANADLSFTTRKEAEQAPQRLANQNIVDLATGIVAAQLGVDPPTALARLQDAASRAGVSLLHLARDIVTARERKDQDSD
jgi:GAF domain-containing protein